MEKKTEVRSFEVTYICDECKEGTMIYIGEITTNWSLKFQHRCEKCFHMQDFDLVYPIIRYEPLGFGQSDMIGPISPSKKEFCVPIDLYDVFRK